MKLLERLLTSGLRVYLFGLATYVILTGIIIVTGAHWQRTLILAVALGVGFTLYIWVLDRIIDRSSRKRSGQLSGADNVIDGGAP